MAHIVVRGAGIGGLSAALVFARRGEKVTLLEKEPSFVGNASWYAGGMLAPYCERESAEEVIERRGVDAIDWWDKAYPGGVTHEGTLVVANPRDRSELTRFADRTNHHTHVGAEEITLLEPDLASGFQQGLLYKGEAHMDARKAMQALLDQIIALGVTVVFNADPDHVPPCDYEIDCRGMEADLAGTRGVRGEMLILHAPDVTLNRTVRLLHPRIPLYVVPRADKHFMIGATMIENDHDGPITVRSMMELLNAAYSLSPAFAEAEIVETGVGVRPAFEDNLPRLQRVGNKLTINGFYRHGYALGPLLAEAAADWLLNDKMDADFCCGHNRGRAA